MAQVSETSGPPLPNEPNGCPIEAVIEHNRLEVEQTDERHFVRDSGLLESALARPRNFYRLWRRGHCRAWPSP